MASPPSSPSPMRRSSSLKVKPPAMKHLQLPPSPQPPAADDDDEPVMRRSQSLKNPPRRRTRIFKVSPTDSPVSPRSPVAPGGGRGGGSGPSSRRVSVTEVLPPAARDANPGQDDGLLAHGQLDDPLQALSRHAAGGESHPRRASYDKIGRKRLPRGSQDYTEAMRRCSITGGGDDGDDDDAGIEVISAAAENAGDGSDDMVDGSHQTRPGSSRSGAARFVSKTAEEICLKNLKAPYPKYMETLTSPPPESPPAAGKKGVTFGGRHGAPEVFKFDEAAVNGGGGGGLGRVPEDGSLEAAGGGLDVPHRLRRARSAKTRPKPSVSSLTGLGGGGGCGGITEVSM